MRPAPWLLALLSLVAACRFGFDRVPVSDAVPIDAAPDAPLPVLPCGAPPQFSLGGTTTALAATATDTGYYAFAVDATGAVHGFSYAFDGAQLMAGASDAPVYTGATGSAAAIAVGDGVLAAIPYGRPTEAGTALIALDGKLVSGAPQLTPAWYGLDAMLARAGDGTLAFLGQQDSGDFLVKLVSPTGQGLGTPHTAIEDRIEDVITGKIAPMATGFLVTWNSHQDTAANLVRAEVLDSRLAVIVPPTTINTGAMFDGANPRGAYAAARDRTLFAWSFKTSKSDEVWVSLRDGKLVEIIQVQVAPHGVQPRVIAGQSNFLVVWQDSDTTSGLNAARVDFDGKVEALPVPSNGGKQQGWDLVTRAGQPAVVWLEAATALNPTPNLWLNALCN